MEKLEKAVKLENETKMASAHELFMRILDDQDEIKKAISEIQIELACQKQAFKDYCKSVESQRSQQQSNRSDWKWAAGVAISLTLAAVSVIINVWPK